MPRCRRWIRKHIDSRRPSQTGQALPADTVRAIAERLAADHPSLRLEATGLGLSAWRAGERVLLIDRGMLEVGPILCDHWEIEDEDLPSWFAAALQPSCTLIAVPMLVSPGDEAPSIESIPIGVVAPAGGLPCIFTVRTDADEVWQVPAGEPRCSLDDLPAALRTAKPSAWSLNERLPLTRFQTAGGASVYILADPAPHGLVLDGYVDLPGAGVRAGCRDWVANDESTTQGSGLRRIAGLTELANLDDQRALRLDGDVLLGPAGRRWRLARP